MKLQSLDLTSFKQIAENNLAPAILVGYDGVDIKGVEDGAKFKLKFESN